MRSTLIGISLILLIFITSGSHTSAYLISDQYTNLNGDSVSFSIYDGSYLFVDAMATWCPHCQAQHTVLNQVYQEFSSEMNMLTLSVSSDDSLNDLKNFVADHNNPWDAGLDSDQSFGSSHNVQSYPTMILFTPTGGEITRWVGETSFSKLQSDLNYIILNSIVETSQIQSSVSIGQVGGDSSGSGSSIIGNLFGSPIFQAFLVISIILVIYVRSVGSPKN
jgi:thiol-disulfide isomerase/thioredoxin